MPTSRVYWCGGPSDQAIRYFEDLQRLQPENPTLLGNLAAAYAATGQMSRAVKTAEAALQQAIASKSEPLARTLRWQLQEHEE